MPIYTMSQASILERACSLRKARIWASCVFTALLIASSYLLFRSYESPGLNHPYFGFPERVFIVLFVTLMQLIRPYPWRRPFVNIAKKAVVTVEIANDEIDVSCGLLHRRIAVQDIVKAEESSWGSGLCLRTPKRYHYAFIPRRIDGYNEIRKYMTLMEIPIVKTTISAGWEGYLFAVLFCSSLICDIFATSRMVLSVNSGVGLLIAVAGIIFSRSSQGRPMRLMSLAGSFIPAVWALVALLLATGRS